MSEGKFDMYFFLNLQELGVTQLHLNLRGFNQLQEEWKDVYVPTAADGLPRDCLGQICDVKVYLDI